MSTATTNPAEKPPPSWDWRRERLIRMGCWAGEPVAGMWFIERRPPDQEEWRRTEVYHEPTPGVASRILPRWEERIGRVGVDEFPPDPRPRRRRR